MAIYSPTKIVSGAAREYQGRRKRLPLPEFRAIESPCYRRWHKGRFRIGSTLGDTYNRRPDEAIQPHGWDRSSELIPEL
jgi:hypothetical protein